jgi:hypothetical protein
VEAEDVVNVDTTLEATDDLQEISKAASFQFYLTPNPGKRKVNPNVPKDVSSEPTSASACDICECEHGTLGYFDGTGTVYCEGCFEEYPPDELWWGGEDEGDTDCFVDDDLEHAEEMAFDDNKIAAMNANWEKALASMKSNTDLFMVPGKRAGSMVAAGNTTGLMKDNPKWLKD